MVKIALYTILLAGAAGLGFLFARAMPGAQSGYNAVVEPGGCPHNIDESMCPFCKPELMESLGFCGEHDVPEAICTRCNDALIPAFRTRNDWCAEHDLPESQCLLCNPGLARSGGSQGHDHPHDPDAPVSADASKPEDIEILALPSRRTARPPAVDCRTDRLIVRLVSEEAARSADIRTAPVRIAPISESLRCNAEIVYDANRYSRLSARVRGVVREIHKDLGDRVEPGETLLVIDSAILAAAKAQFLQTRALVRLAETSHERAQRFLKSGTGSEMEALEIETELAERRIELARALQELRNLGLSDAQIDDVAAKEDTGSLLPITASIAGEVVERTTAVGEVAEPAAPLMAIADTGRVWAMLDVAETDAARLNLGNPVVVQVDALPGETFGGRVTWLSSRLDPLTRTVKARAELENERRVLRANMFGSGRVALHEREDVLIVPKASVQWEGCCNIVFVQESAAVYRPRKVRLGCAVDDFYEVEQGLQKGESVVTQGSFLLKTEIMRGNLGAGCCEVARSD